MPPSWNILILAPPEVAKDRQRGSLPLLSLHPCSEVRCKAEDLFEPLSGKVFHSGFRGFFPPTTLNAKPQTLNPGLGFRVCGWRPPEVPTCSLKKSSRSLGFLVP